MTKSPPPNQQPPPNAGLDYQALELACLRATIGLRQRLSRAQSDRDVPPPANERSHVQVGPLHNDEVLETLVTRFGDMYQRLNEQMKLIARMQHQLDELSTPSPAGNLTE